MTAMENKFLKVAPGVVLTPIIEPVIIELDKYFADAKKIAWVTSGLRDANMQLSIIRSYLERRKLRSDYEDAFGCQVQDTINWDSKKVYAWQPGWSALLNEGVIINPPLKAECLFDYIRNGKNKKGQFINPSPHFFGTAFDIGGGSMEGITDELPIVQKALKEKLPGLKNILAEHANNAIHCDCIAI